MKCATLADLICKIKRFHLILLLQRGKVLVWFACLSWVGREGMAFCRVIRLVSCASKFNVRFAVGRATSVCCQRFPFLPLAFI